LHEIIKIVDGLMGREHEGKGQNREISSKRPCRIFWTFFSLRKRLVLRAPHGKGEIFVGMGYFLRSESE
jgi:hypothetical protein